MSIENVGSMNKILKNYQASDWTKSIDLEGTGSISQDLNIESEGGKTKSFSDFLMNSVKDVNDLQLKANESMEKLATGNKADIHETLIAVEKAEIAFKAMNQIRQKVIEAYKEVMRMQV
jgi:flagellar hook-basal body complex protein FliE